MLPDAQRALHLALWCDVLEDWRLDQISVELRQWLIDHPTRRPNAGHIRQRLIRRRGAAVAARRAAMPRVDPEPEAPRAEPQRVKAILVEVLGGCRKEAPAAPPPPPGDPKRVSALMVEMLARQAPTPADDAHTAACAAQRGLQP